MLFPYGAMVFFCLVETERGGVISLLPDNLSEIGVEYVEVSYFILIFGCYIYIYMFLFIDII